MNDTLPRSNGRAIRYAGYGLMAASPFLLLLILSLITGHNVLNAYPVWSDELGYWRSLYSLNEMGLHTGYYGTMESVAQVGTLGISGLGPVLIYGWFVKLFGIAHNSIILCNAVWISLAALVFCALRKPSPRISFMLSALILCYAPMVLYAFTSMTECFNFALVLLYLTFLLTYQERRRPWLMVLCCLTIVMGCLYRALYAVLFIPLILFFSRYRFGKRMIIAGLISAVLAFACCWLSQLCAAPNALGFPYHLLNAPDAATFVQMLISHAKSNLMDYFVRPTHSPMQDAFRIMYFGLMFVCLICTFVKFRRTEENRFRLQKAYQGPMLSSFLFLLAAFVFVTLFYETYDWQDFRLLAPCMFLVLTYLIIRRRVYIPLLSLGACLVTVILLMMSPEGAFVDADRFQAPEVSDNLTEIAYAIPFDEETPNPFDNTIRLDILNYPLVESLHPGLGLQYGWFTTETTGKSRWILTDQLKCAVSGYENVLNAGDYKLYRKMDDREGE